MYLRPLLVDTVQQGIFTLAYIFFFDLLWTNFLNTENKNYLEWTNFLLLSNLFFSLYLVFCSPKILRSFDLLWINFLNTENKNYLEWTNFLLISKHVVFSLSCFFVRPKILRSIEFINMLVLAMRTKYTQFWYCKFYMFCICENKNKW